VFDGPLEDGQLLARGQILHGHGGPVGQPKPIRVATEWKDPAAFEDLLVRRLSGHAG